MSRYDRVAVDTETTGLGYRDRPVGLSWATPDGQSGYLAWGHGVAPVGSIFDAPAEANNCSLADVRVWAKEQLTGSQQRRIMHNAPFDLRMLAYAGIGVDQVEDTLVAAPVLNELEPSFALGALSKKYLGREKSDDELNAWCASTFGGQATRRDQAKNYWRAPASIVGPYARGDTELTLALYDALRPKVTAEGLDEVYALETAIIPIVVDMHLTGVRVDLDAAHALDAALTQQIDVLRTEWHRLSGGAEPGKMEQIVPLFHAAGLTVPVRKKNQPSTIADGGSYSLQAEDLERMPHPLAQTLWRWRKLTRHRDLFVRTYVLANADETGVVHGEFHALRSDEFGAVSGRFSSGSSDGSLNLQNLPSRDEDLAAAIRGLFVPYERGWRWVKADYSQIQFRLLAHYAALIGHPALAQAYRTNPDADFHQLCAEITSIPRGDAKHINFGFVFGMGKPKLARKLGLTEEAAEKIFATYHRKLPAVRATYDALSRRANAKGQIRTLGGRLRRFPSAEEARRRGWDVHRNEQYVGCHKGLNALLQGGEADIVKRAMVALRPVAKEYGALLHLTVHDEFDYSGPPETAAPFARRMQEVMEDVQLEVPVRADVSTGRDWGHADEDVAPLAEAA